MSDTKDKLKQVLVKALRLERDPSTIPESRLADELGIDSIKSLEFLVWVENEFGIQIEDSDLSVRLVDSLDVLAEYVDAKRRSVAEAAK